MNKKSESSEPKEETSRQKQSAEKQAETVSDQQQQQQQAVNVDDSAVIACYANFCRVSSTPEELIMDLGLNPNPYATGDQTINVSQRIIMNHYTAKRLVAALSMALQRHEQAFGVLETDIRKRVRTNA